MPKSQPGTTNTIVPITTFNSTENKAKPSSYTNKEDVFLESNFNNLHQLSIRKQNNLVTNAKYFALLFNSLQL